MPTESTFTYALFYRRYTFRDRRLDTVISNTADRTFNARERPETWCQTQDVKSRRISVTNSKKANINIF